MNNRQSRLVDTVLLRKKPSFEEKTRFLSGINVLQHRHKELRASVGNNDRCSLHDGQLHTDNSVKRNG